MCFSGPEVWRWSHKNFFFWFICWLKMDKIFSHINIKFFKLSKVFQSMLISSLLCQQLYFSLGKGKDMHLLNHFIIMYY